MLEKLENLSAILLIAVLIANIVIIATHKKPTKEDFDPIVPDVHIMKWEDIERIFTEEQIEMLREIV